MPIILDGTAGLTNNATALNYTGTLTGGTGVVNLGSGQLVKDASGNVGIGTSSPTEKLVVAGSAIIANSFFNSGGGIELNIQGSGDRSALIDFHSSGAPGALDFSSRIIRNASANGDFAIQNTGSGANIFVSNGVVTHRIYSDGTFSFGPLPGANQANSFSGNATGAIFSNIASGAYTNHVYSSTTNSFRFYVSENGGINNFSGNNVNLSDERTKTNIGLAGGYLEKICAIPVKLFNYKDEPVGEQRTLGVIAQDVEAVAPEFVNNNGWLGKTTEDGTPLKAVYSNDMVFGLMKAIQEQQALITALTARITALEAK